MGKVVRFTRTLTIFNHGVPKAASVNSDEHPNQLSDIITLAKEHVNIPVLYEFGNAQVKKGLESTCASVASVAWVDRVSTRFSPGRTVDFERR
jgi:hypothetical protein